MKKIIIDKNKLKQLYNIYNMNEIAKILNCSFITINRNIKKYKIITRKNGVILKGNINNITKEFLIQLYEVEKKEISDIAKILFSTVYSVKNKLKLFNIPIRKYNISQKRKEWWGKNKELRSGKNASFYGKKHTKQTKRKMSITRKNKTTKEMGHKNDCHCCICKMKRGEAFGKNNSMYGKHHTEKTKKLQSLARGGTGIPYENTEYGAEFDNALKEQVRLRDGYKCKLCGCSQVENGKQLSVHHIDYNKQNNNINNLVALCIYCHRKTNEHRKIYINYFRNLTIQLPSDLNTQDKISKILSIYKKDGGEVIELL